MRVSRRLNTALPASLLIPVLAIAVITGCPVASPVEEDEVSVRLTPPQWLHGTWTTEVAEDLILRFSSTEVIMRFGELAKQFGPEQDRSITLDSHNLVLVSQDPYTLRYSSGGSDTSYTFNKQSEDAMEMVANPGFPIRFFRAVEA